MTQSTAVVAVFEGHSDAVFHLRFSPDGARIVSAGADKLTRIWHMPSENMWRAAVTRPAPSPITGSARAASTWSPCCPFPSPETVWAPRRCAAKRPSKPQTSHPGEGDLDCRYGTGTVHHSGTAVWVVWALGLWWVCGKLGAGGLRHARGGVVSSEPATTGLRLGTYRALIIGVDVYKDSETWPKLQAPVKDVPALHSILTTQYGFKAEHTTLLTNEQATVKNVKAALNKLRAKSSPEDHVVVYYAGHGDYENEFDGKKEGGCAGFCTMAGSRNCESRRLSAGYLTRQLAKVKAKHMLLMADSCFSGAGMRSGAAKSNSTKAHYQNELRKSASQVLTSGDQDAKSSTPTPPATAPLPMRS